MIFKKRFHWFQKKKKKKTSLSKKKKKPSQPLLHLDDDVSLIHLRLQKERHRLAVFGTDSRCTTTPHMMIDRSIDRQTDRCSPSSCPLVGMANYSSTLLRYGTQLQIVILQELVCSMQSVQRQARESPIKSSSVDLERGKRAEIS